MCRLPLHEPIHLARAAVSVVIRIKIAAPALENQGDGILVRRGPPAGPPSAPRGLSSSLDRGLPGRPTDKPSHTLRPKIPIGAGPTSLRVGRCSTLSRHSGKELSPSWT